LEDFTAVYQGRRAINRTQNVTTLSWKRTLDSEENQWEYGSRHNWGQELE
jgi:hypothetical protein